MSKLTDSVKTEVIQRLQRPEQSVAHRFDHIERVMGNAVKIASTIEEVDYEILELAVLLHDVEQPSGRKAEHVQLSSQAAAEILRRFDCPADRIESVLKVIAEHSTEHVRSIRPSSQEARILFDADKLDGIGQTGIARVFALFGQMNMAPFEAIEWYERKIGLAVEYMQTDEGRRLVQSRLPYVLEFLSQMKSEARSSSGIWQSL